MLGEREVGRIFVSTPSLMSGYFRNAEATAAVMGGDGFLDTGDMGYWLDGEIVITGRAKDLILHNGRNIWPQDIEWAAEQIEPLRSGDVAAFAVEGEDGADEVVVLVQCRLHDPEPMEALRREMAAEVHRSCRRRVRGGAGGAEEPAVHLLRQAVAGGRQAELSRRRDRRDCRAVLCGTRPASKPRSERPGALRPARRSIMTETIAITGATGFIGRMPCRLLAPRPPLRVLVRDPARRAGPARRRRGGPGRPCRRRRAGQLVTGADAVVHLAGAIAALRPRRLLPAPTRGAPRRWPRPRSARASGRFVHVSCLAAREPQLSHYGASKRAGEEAVARAAAGLNAVICGRPPSTARAIGARCR